MDTDEIKIAAGDVVEVNSREHLERLIFGNNLTVGADRFKYFARKSFLDSVDELMRQGGRLVKH